MDSNENTDRLWQEVWALIRHHQKPPRDATPQAALNRLYREWCGRIDELPRILVGSDTCETREESLSWEELLHLRVWHDKNNPKLTDLPIIVFKYDTGALVMDGGNRVNQWRASTPRESYPAIVVSLRRA